MKPKRNFMIEKRNQDGSFAGMMSGIGRNKKSWDFLHHTKREAQKALEECLLLNDGCTYTIIED
jgi:hypothetical protein